MAARHHRQETLYNRAWNEIYSGTKSLDDNLAKRLLREWQGLKIEDVNLGGLSIDILKRMKPSELEKLMQGKTIAHISDVVSFMQQLQVLPLARKLQDL